MHVLCAPSETDFHRHLLTQNGHGIQVYQGANMRGQGIFGLLRSIGKIALPLVRNVAKTVGKSALKGGIQVMSDVASGQDFKQSLKNRAAQQTVNAVKQLTSSGKRKGIKRKGGKPPQRRKTKKKAKTTEVY